MADETLTMTIGQALISEADEVCIAGAKRETPLQREAAVLRLVKAGDDAFVENRAGEFFKKRRAMDQRPKVRRGSP